jgi:hypothetical protein
MSLERQVNMTIPAPRLVFESLSRLQTGVIPRLWAYLEPTPLQDFLQYQPQFWLFRFRTQKTRRLPTQVRRNTGVWTHPTHLNGATHVGERFWSGNNSSTNQGQLRETEWPIVVGQPFSPLELTGINLPSYWCHFNSRIILSPASFPISYITPFFGNQTGNPVGLRSANSRTNIRTLVLSCAIGIRNPDPTAALTTPWIHGPIGNIVYFQPAIRRTGPGPVDRLVVSLHGKHSLHAY